MENYLYDVRVRATMPGGVDDRIVIVDIDIQQSIQCGRRECHRGARIQRRRSSGEVIVAEECPRAAVSGCRIIPASQRTEAHVDEVAALVKGCGHIKSGRALGHPEETAECPVEILKLEAGITGSVR